MKANRLYKLLWLFAAIPLLFACNDDAPYYGTGIESEFNKIYSNKSNKDHVTADLELKYSGDVYMGKEVRFQLMTKNSARLTFTGVFPGEWEAVVDGIELTATTDGYTFSGSYETPGNTTFDLSGTVSRVEGKTLPVLTLDLTNVTMPANRMSKIGTLTLPEYSGVQVDPAPGLPGYKGNIVNHSLLFDWKFAYTFTDSNGDNVTKDQNILFIPDPNNPDWDDDMTILLGPVLSNLLYLLLTDITFHPDGNITATYSSMPEDLNFFSLISGTKDSDRGPKNVSPRNLITYHIDSNDRLYIRPELETIMHLIATNNAGTRAEDDGGGLLGGLDLGDIDIIGLLNQILTVYNGTQKWLTTGIEFTFEGNDPEEAILDYIPYQYELPVNPIVYYFGGDYKLYTVKKQLDPLLVLLPLILENVDLSFGNGMIDLTELMELVTPRIPLTRRLNLGLYLN